MGSRIDAAPRWPFVMQILVVTEFLPSSDRGEITGGVEAYCHYVGRELEHDHQVTFIADRTDGQRWDHASLGSIPRRLAFLVRALVQGLRADADVVMGTNYVVHPVAWLIGVLRRRPVVFWYPDVLIGQWRNGQFGRITGVIGELSERLILRLPVARYIAISQSTADKLVARGVKRERIDIVPCGYDEAVVAEIGTPPPPPQPRVVVVGRLVPYKRVDLVLDAVARLRDRWPELELVVIGRGPEEERLEAQAQALGISGQVRFAGHLACHADVLREVAGSTVFVSASEIEGFGIVVVEASALGCPIVVSDIAVFREVTAEGTGGLLFRAGDAAHLAEQLDRLLADPDLRAVSAREGRAHASRYRWSEIAQRTAATFQDVVHPHTRSTSHVERPVP